MLKGSRKAEAPESRGSRLDASGIDADRVENAVEFEVDQIQVTGGDRKEVVTPHDWRHEGIDAGTMHRSRRAGSKKSMRPPSPW